MSSAASGGGESVTDDVSLGTAVVEAVSASTGRPVTDLPPLYDAVDPDALDALFAGRSVDGRVRFRYAGHVVEVRSDRTVTLPADD